MVSPSRTTYSVNPQCRSIVPYGVRIGGFIHPYASFSDSDSDSDSSTGTPDPESQSHESLLVNGSLAQDIDGRSNPIPPSEAS